MLYLRRTIILLAALCAIAPSAFGQAVDISVDQFGVGGYFRPGLVVPIRLKLVSKLAEPTPVWAQWEVPNADGDIGEYGRSLTLTPNVPALVWLYAPLPPSTDNSTVWSVRVFEERDGQRRREIAGTRISPVSNGGTVVELERGLMAVIGHNNMGLRDYSVPGSQMNAPMGAHEDTRVIDGLSPGQLPDRWEGLAPFEAVAWGGDREPPTDLSLDQANALREYVRHGGHLIICLPAAGNPWSLGAPGQNQLEDLLPRKAPRKDEAVPVRSLVPLLSKTDNIRGNIEVSLRVFKDLLGPFNAIDNRYEPLLALPDGRVVAIQRTFGFGRITVIGIDLADGRMAGLGLPQADAFWNRILGRRNDTPSYDELRQIESANRLSRRDLRDINFGSGPLFTSRINMLGSVGVGVLLALVMFAAYWAIAGPGGFFILKQYKKTHHAWVAFAICAGAFTALAWGSVGLIPRQMSVQHVTILDHIARPPDDPRPEEPQYQRAVSFFSAYLPSYKATPMEIATTSGSSMRDLLFSWTPPGDIHQAFPVGSSRVDLQACKLEYSIVSPK